MRGAVQNSGFELRHAGEGIAAAQHAVGEFLNQGLTRLVHELDVRVICTCPRRRSLSISNFCISGILRAERLSSRTCTDRPRNRMVSIC